MQSEIISQLASELPAHNVTVLYEPSLGLPYALLVVLSEDGRDETRPVRRLARSSLIPVFGISDVGSRTHALIKPLNDFALTLFGKARIEAVAKLRITLRRAVRAQSLKYRRRAA